MKKKYSVLSIILYTLSSILFILLMTSYTLEQYELQHQYQLIKFISAPVVLLFFVVFLFSLILSTVGLVKIKKPILSIVIPSSMSLGFIFLAVVILVSQKLTPKIVGECTITNHGVFEIPEKVYPDGTSKLIFSERRLIENTDTIFAQLGTQFGFNYSLDGLPQGRSIKIKEIIKYPGEGLLESGKRKDSEISYLNVGLGSLSYAGYKLSEKKYLMEGKWTFEFWYENKMILSRDFYVISKNKVVI